jgi:cell wall-associated NlpC family hydrolase
MLFFVFLIAGCQTDVRFSSNSHYGKQNNNGSKDVDNATNNNKRQSSDLEKYYDSPAKIIYPKNPINTYSNKIVNVAEMWLGTPYIYGGNTRKGVDCSGFVKNVYSEIGVNLPRTSGEQFEYTSRINSPSIGDLVFFKKNNKINHVAIYIGDGKIIHAAIKKGVIVQSLPGTSLEKNFAGYGRVKSIQ